MSVMHRVVLLFLLSTTSVWSYSRFRDAIPNGHVVPNPCYNVKGGQEEVWAGVGHKDINGGGELNPFGETFQANNLTYSTAVCQADSDGDGLTNGQELGDPTCVWSVGETPKYGPKGHPGICEPVGSQRCKDSWFHC